MVWPRWSKASEGGSLRIVGPSSDLGGFDGFPDQADGIDLDLMEEATLDLSAGSCRREYEGV